MKKLRPRVIKKLDTGPGVRNSYTSVWLWCHIFSILKPQSGVILCSELFNSFPPHSEENPGPCHILQAVCDLTPWFSLPAPPPISHLLTSPLATVASLIPPICEEYSDRRPCPLLLLLPEPTCPHGFAWLTSLTSFKSLIK